MRIEPYKSVGELLFSDNRQIIRKKLNSDFETGTRSSENESEPYDLFKDQGLFVYYDKNGTIEAFEFFEGDILFNDFNIFKNTYHAILQFFTDLDPELDIRYNNFTSFKYGVGCNTNDDPEEPEAIPEAFIVFKVGYYDELLQQYGQLF